MDSLGTRQSTLYDIEHDADSDYSAIPPLSPLMRLQKKSSIDGSTEPDADEDEQVDDNGEAIESAAPSMWVRRLEREACRISSSCVGTARSDITKTAQDGSDSGSFSPNFTGSDLQSTMIRIFGYEAPLNDPEVVSSPTPQSKPSQYKSWAATGKSAISGVARQTVIYASHLSLWGVRNPLAPSRSPRSPEEELGQISPTLDAAAIVNQTHLEYVDRWQNIDPNRNLTWPTFGPRTRRRAARRACTDTPRQCDTLAQIGTGLAVLS